MDWTIAQLINRYFDIKFDNEKIKQMLNEKNKYLVYVTNEEVIFEKKDGRAKVEYINENKIEITSGFNLTFVCILVDNKLKIELRQNAEDFAEYFQDYNYFEMIIDENKTMQRLNKAHSFHCLDSLVILNDKQLDKLSNDEKNHIIDDAVINFFENFENEEYFEDFLDNLINNMCIILDSDVPESVRTIMKFSNF